MKFLHSAIVSMAPVSLAVAEHRMERLKLVSQQVKSTFDYVACIHEESILLQETVHNLCKGTHETVSTCLAKLDRILEALAADIADEQDKIRELRGGASGSGRHRMGGPILPLGLVPRPPKTPPPKEPPPKEQEKEDPENFGSEAAPWVQKVKRRRLI